MPAQLINRFFQDERLPQLAEHLRSSSDLLDIVNLNENQHSDVLKWCLSPKEAHGQGEEVLRDFLLAASCALAKDVESGSHTGQFFRKWTPASIYSAGFGSALVLREFRLSESSRCDLLIVDLQNRFIVVIENKRSARMDDSQLQRYEDELLAIFAGDKASSRFSIAFVALDVEPPSGNDPAFKELRRRWVFLDYQWLKRSAERARLHIKRGNQSARLVLAYCEHQLQDIDDPSDELALAIATGHPEIVEELRQIRPRELRRSLLQELKNDNPLTMFALQNIELVRRLTSISAIASIAARLEREYPWLAFRATKTVVDTLPKELLAKWSCEEDSLPLVIRCRRLKGESPQTAVYKIRLVWNGMPEDSISADEIKAVAAAAFAEHRGGTAPDFNTVKRLTLLDNATEDEAVAKLQEINYQVNRMAVNLD
jgi:hypothetical protein